jgi:hypothetical protein
MIKDIDLDQIDKDLLKGVEQSELDKFFDNRIWKCIKADLSRWYIQMAGILEEAPKEDIYDPTTGTLIRMGVSRTQGQLLRLGQLIGIEETYKQEVKMIKEEENAGKEEKRGSSS